MTPRMESLTPLPMFPLHPVGISFVPAWAHFHCLAPGRASLHLQHAFPSGSCRLHTLLILCLQTGERERYPSFILISHLAPYSPTTVFTRTVHNFPIPASMPQDSNGVPQRSCFPIISLLKTCGYAAFSPAASTLPTFVQQRTFK